MTEPLDLTPAASLPTEFAIHEVLAAPRTTGTPPAPPSLGPLAAFVDNWSGNGFNTIFRPDNKFSPTELPVQPPPNNDNILELNLTSENLSFSKSLGSVPNRGMLQRDLFLNGVPYLQAINDVTTGQSVGIHLEPGLWVIVPATPDPQPGESPALGESLVRMASIPHGTTILAQGTSTVIPGAPTIPPAPITPSTATPPGGTGTPIRFASQTAADQTTPRIPQDLTAFIAAGTITQELLDDPNVLLRRHIDGLRITSTTAINISTHPALPLFGGGNDDIAFLLGNPVAVTDPAPNPPVQNAQSIELSATFWIETVERTITVAPFSPGQPPVLHTPDPTHPGQPVPTFLVRPPFQILEPREITFTSTQIQYSQRVILNFNGLSWPHVSVATLVPAAPVPVPPTAWT